MSCLSKFVLLAALAAQRVFAGGDCVGAGSFCAALHPGMVVFIGKQASISIDKDRIPTVTFEIVEPLWGLDGVAKVAVVFIDRYPAFSGARFLAVTPMRDGRYELDGCGGGLILPMEHMFVQEFRRNLRDRRPARVPIQIVSSDYIPIDKATARLTGTGGVFEARVGGPLAPLLSFVTRGCSVFDTLSLPPGTYQVIAAKPGFTLDGGQNSVSILPGSCAPLRVRMSSGLHIGGRMLTKENRGVSNASIHLMGSARSGWSEYPAWRNTKTDSEGRFSFAGVLPGRYYLVSDISEIDDTFRRPIPKTYYPGVHNWREASQLHMTEERSLDNVVFRLPDFGKPRRLDVLVVSEDNVPVSGAVLQDGGLDPSDELATNFGGRRTSDAHGRVNLEVWPICNYQLTAALYRQGGGVFSAKAGVPAGDNSATIEMRLEGLRIGTPH